MDSNRSWQSLPTFFKEVKSELTKVTWLSRQQTLRLTAIVIAVSVVVAIFISLLDYLFTKIMGLLI
ncbi:preprotein translocase subunit SecE [Candidatus Woesebacteria bacterium CG_4_10_14_0_2_um_filter_39_14]|uniref:Protein translocase subunit SecE n=2 Tax=Microgenomates group TaxID=1794810 RepID=A0A2M7XL70_9BACT|nr:MAG: preprotein translocase subunit SecE [Candidatus Woesebacteria bacterium CG_4_10_14_0_2_um_filter_39_14]PJA49342.1 MAG: preprotein translocase subunit SecE [Candidatus Shapirobacteria bacterium CG_4_9_14_3_um_filter_39_13]